MKQYFRNVRESIAYGLIIFRSRSFSTKIGMGKLSYGNFQLFERIRKYLLSNDEFLIVDVGANDGWFARIFLNLTPKNSVISFEPLLSQRESLEKLRSQYPNFSYHLNAVGETAGMTTIQEFGTSGLSSLRKLTEGSYQEKQFSTDVTDSYGVQVITLDEYFDKNPTSKKIILKIDTQGYEMEVLKGAQQLLQTGLVEVVLVELMTVEKYSGQTLSTEITNFLENFGFILFDISPSGYDDTTGQMTEFDAVFVRNPRTAKN